MNLLFVDDETHLRDLMERELSDLGHAVTLAANGDEALRSMDAKAFDVVILDLRMPGLDGMGVFRRIRSRGEDPEVLVLTGHATTESAIEALRLGAWDYLTKPCRLDELKVVLERIEAFHTLKQENRTLKRDRARYQRQPILLGESAPLRAVREQITKVAQGDAPILLQGETGTGKELAARAIHEQSTRRDRAFVVLDCGQISDSLLESELYGHEQGAFTGAVHAREGIFEAAHRGTLFLDEIADLPVHLQSKLLRAVETGEVRRLGSTTLRKVDVRIVCATRGNLAEAVSCGRFREDFYYRLQGVEILLPPLRDRPEDVPLLIQEFLRRYPSPRLKNLDVDPSVVACLAAWNWPGNVRELENVVQRIVLLADRTPVQLHDLAQFGVLESGGSASPRGRSLADMERAHILRILRETHGSKSQAAEFLGISLKTLYNKLTSYGLSAPD
ncbi:MAG: sigma-54-dependent Fis family transcriptional regulator [Planctomycetes bacterium]|nr:sigma-54-dependent Fis family transcriptional regulator [Planctomycetota bacterium]